MGCMLSQVAAKFAFFQPSPPTYKIQKGEHDSKLSVVTASATTHTTSLLAVPPVNNSLDVLQIDTKRGNKIVAFYLRNPYARLTLLYSHGNATDLGQLYDLFLQLNLSLRVNLIGYDYSGYGASTGKVVYECLATEYGVSQEDLILYGQSVGSGPTLHLAVKLPRLRGVVLHSAILSGHRVLCHVKFTFCFDIYKNFNKIKKVKCPVLVIHFGPIAVAFALARKLLEGSESSTFLLVMPLESVLWLIGDDDIVNWLHGNALWKMARDPYEPSWIKGGEHCNLELYPDYIRHLCRFILGMENITTEFRLKKIRQNMHLQKKRSCAICASMCCRIKLYQPKCPECSRPKCLKFPTCWKPCIKCSWRPKCPKCAGPSCCFRSGHWRCCGCGLNGKHDG